MENLDVFESVFKRALRVPYDFQERRIARPLLITDLGDPAAYADKVRAFVGAEAEWTVLKGADYARWADLADIIAEKKPDFIVCYRLLQEKHEVRKFSLGAYVDTLTQAVDAPVLILPAPHVEAPFHDRDSVLVVTDHLEGQHELVHWAAALAQRGATLHLCHLEDADAFAYYMHAVEQIPEINTDVVREKLREQLLAQPGHYIASVEKSLKRRRPDLSVRSSVTFGHVIDHYRALLKERRADLLVFRGRDASQLAMHSMGYSIAVEFRDTPLLLV